MWAQYGGRDGEVVLNQLGLEDAVLGPEHLVQVRQLDLALADLNDLGGTGHNALIIAGRRR